MLILSQNFSREASNPSASSSKRLLQINILENVSWILKTVCWRNPLERSRHHEIRNLPTIQTTTQLDLVKERHQRKIHGRLVKEKSRMLSMGQRKRLQLARLLAIDRPIWLLDEPSVAFDDEGVRLLEYIIAEHRKKGGIVIVATHLPIEIDDAMILRLPPRFPRKMTLIDMLDRADIS
ncbi:hypothetical protein YC2023_010740 [Brassica napus]